MNEDFRPRGLHRFIGFAVFLLCFALSMFLGTVLFALEMGLTAVLAMFIGVSLSSFAGLLTTHRLCRKDLEAFKRSRVGTYVMPDDRLEHH